METNVIMTATGTRHLPSLPSEPYPAYLAALLCGTAIAYGPPAPYAMCGTEIAYGAIGRKANTGGLGLEEAGVKLGKVRP
eukprot:2845468-Rhodomonas_salina.1